MYMHATAGAHWDLQGDDAVLLLLWGTLVGPSTDE